MVQQPPQPPNPYQHPQGTGQQPDPAQRAQFGAPQSPGSMGMPGIPAGGGYPGGFDADGGDFTKKKNPLLLIIGMLVAVGVAIAAVGITWQKDNERMPPDKAWLEIKRIKVLPKTEQLPLWRQHAQSQVSPDLKEESLKQLAWARDPEGVNLAIAALSDPEQKIRAQAARALAEYGLPDADKARPALLKALAEAKPESRPQIAWALVVLGEKAALKQILELYRTGRLSGVRNFEGGVAFDPNKIVQLVSMDELAAWHNDESGAVRQLVATVLSRAGDAKYTDQLIALVKDPDEEISRQAAPGLGKIGDAKAREPLIEKLKGANPEKRKAYLLALRDGVGTPGLVMGLDSVIIDDEQKAWHRTEQIFKMMRELAHPGGADALNEYMESDKPQHFHWKLQAAMALAEVGDVRAVPTLARRLRMDAQKIYGDDHDYLMMLKRNNNERRVSARMIADLAVLHPDKAEQLREQAEDAIIFWIHELPMPHANGLRALAAMNSTADIDALRQWSDPKEPLPLEGQQPPMPDEWVIAQSALRYVGWMKDERSWGVLKKQLTRRKDNLDVTMDGLMGGGVAILGMSLRAIGVGAADGFSEWRDPKAFEPLLKYIEEPKENEQSREAACRALAWVATDEDMIKVAEKIEEYSGTEYDDQFRRSCLLETLIQRPIPNTSAALMTLLTPESSMAVRHQVARAIGKAGLTPEIEAQLFEKLKDVQLMNDAALALMLGGSPDVAARAVASLEGNDRAAIEELQELWYNSFGYWSEEDLEKGHIFRFVDNAVAASRVEFRDPKNQAAEPIPQNWVTVQLERQFDNLLYDNGPHSFTRVVLRKRLMDMAQGKDAEKRAGAIRTLKFMGEQGVLLSLRDGGGEAGKMAGEAYHELTHPNERALIGVKDIARELSEE